MRLSVVGLISSYACRWAATSTGLLATQTATMSRCHKCSAAQRAFWTAKTPMLSWGYGSVERVTCLQVGSYIDRVAGDSDSDDESLPQVQRSVPAPGQEAASEAAAQELAVPEKPGEKGKHKKRFMDMGAMRKRCAFPSAGVHVLVIAP